MTFAVTKYIFPIEKAIPLSELLGYTFDNPRTEKEIQLIKDFISKTFQVIPSDKESRILPLPTRAIFSIGDLKEELKKVDDKSYALKYYDDNYEKDIISILAETWIIIRMPEQEEFKEFAYNRDKLFGTILSRKETDYYKSFYELLSYSYLVSLLSHDQENYHGESFLLSRNPYEIFLSTNNEYVYESLEEFTGYSFLIKHENRAKNWLYWLDGFEKVLSEALRIDSLILSDSNVQQIKQNRKRLSQKQTSKQKLLHVGNLLKTSYEHLNDPELILLLQVSIIEYLVTRNPDTNKFNVEDSISRQFKLKCAFLIHSQDKKYDLIQLGEQLSNIYNQRSDLAHGNYKVTFNNKEIVDSVFLLYKFNAYILNIFIDDKQLLEFLKDN